MIRPSFQRKSVSFGAMDVCAGINPSIQSPLSSRLPQLDISTLISSPGENTPKQQAGRMNNILS